MLTDTNRVKKLLSTRATKRGADSTTMAALLALLVGGAMLALGVANVEDGGQGRIGAIRSILADMADEASAALLPMSPFKYEGLPKHGKLALKDGWFLRVDDFPEFELEKSQEGALDFGFKELEGEDAGKHAVVCQNGERLMFQSEEGAAQKAWPLTEKDGVFEADVHEMCGGALCTVFSASRRGTFQFEGVAEEMHALDGEGESAPDSREHIQGKEEEEEVHGHARADTSAVTAAHTQDTHETTQTDEDEAEHRRRSEQDVLHKQAASEFETHMNETGQRSDETMATRLANALHEDQGVASTGAHVEDEVQDEEQTIDNAVIKVGDQYLVSYSPESENEPYTLTSDMNLAAKLKLEPKEDGYFVYFDDNPWLLSLTSSVNAIWPLKATSPGVFEFYDKETQEQFKAKALHLSSI